MAATISRAKKKGLRYLAWRVVVIYLFFFLMTPSFVFRKEFFLVILGLNASLSEAKMIYHAFCDNIFKVIYSHQNTQDECSYFSCPAI